MIEIFACPTIKCSVKGIMGYVPESKRVYLRQEDESIIWCTWDDKTLPPSFSMDRQINKTSEEEIVAHIISTGSTWVEGYVEFKEIAKSWSVVAEKVWLWWVKRKNQAI